MNRKSLALAAALFVTLSPVFAAEEWGTDYKAALAQAAKENKKVLIDFTGSDWCGWCKKMVADTFSKPDFKKFAKENLVLLELDFPQAKPQSGALVAQNTALNDEYKVNGYPTLVLLNSKGKEIARNEGYLAGGPAALKAWVEEAK